MMPPFVVSSASTCFKTTLSPNGTNFIVLASISCANDLLRRRLPDQNFSFRMPCAAPFISTLDI
jgi:hypothetical protein